MRKQNSKAIGVDFKPTGRNYQELVKLTPIKISHATGEETHQSTLPIAIVVSNSLTIPVQATLFNAASLQFVPPSTAPLAQLSSLYGTISYQQILSNTISTNFSCSTVRIIALDNPQQVLQPWGITGVNMEGQLESIPVPSASFYSPFEFQSNILDLDYPIKVDGLTSLNFTMLAASPGGTNRLVMYFYPGRIISPINELTSGTSIKNFAYPNLPSIFNTPKTTYKS